MKIVIIGAGAMGCLYGAMLSDSGNEVWLLDVYKQHIEAIKNNGLIVEQGSKRRIYSNLKATIDPIEIGNDGVLVDMVMIFVKSTITEEAVRKNSFIFTEKTIVITLQNGLGNIEKIAETVDKKSIIAGTTAHGSTMSGPGLIRHGGVGTTVIGELDGSNSDRINTIAKIFRNSGIQTELSYNVIGLIWDKLLVNIGINALTAITQMYNGELLNYPEIEEILEAAVKEAILIAKAKGIVLGYSDAVAHAKDICRLTEANKSSMLQDVQNKRKTEIEMINGAIVKEGKVLGVDTPVNMVLANLVRWKQVYLPTP